MSDKPSPQSCFECCFAHVKSIAQFARSVKGVEKKIPGPGLARRLHAASLSSTPTRGPGTVLAEDGQDDQGQDNEAYAGEPGDVEGFAEEFGKGHGLSRVGDGMEITVFQARKFVTAAVFVGEDKLVYRRQHFVECQELTANLAVEGFDFGTSPILPVDSGHLHEYITRCVNDCGGINVWAGGNSWLIHGFLGGW